MKRQARINLSHYALQHHSNARCICRSKLHLLGPRVEHATKPIYYLCANCGRIFQAGCKDLIAPKEER